MPTLQWKSDFELQIEMLDEQHRHMVELLNKAHDEFVGNASQDAFEQAIFELIDFTDSHFRVEEQWMKSNGSPCYAEHLEQHRGFAQRATAMREDLARGWANLPLEMVDFLKNWMTYHIGTDAAEARFAPERIWRKCA